VAGIDEPSNSVTGPLLASPSVVPDGRLPVRACLSYLIGESPRMRRVYDVMAKIAPATATVLIQGEAGTGKELIARALYENGPRRQRPFVAVDCTAIPDGLMESHLFGHVRGAFTGAVATVPGAFSRAHTGTLFLDEIGELPLHLQSKLLRAIQTREFMMVGGTHPQRVDVRIISATNRDLRDAVRRATFREDLYYRIAVVAIPVPPLRDRKDDLPLLIEHFLRGFTTAYGRQITGITERAMARLLDYPWPGNVRELENCLEQAVLLAEGSMLDREHFPSIGRAAAGGSPPAGLSLRELEKRYILDTLQQVGGNRSKAARILQISVRGLHNKLRRYVEEESQKTRGGRKRAPRLASLQEPRDAAMAKPPSKTA
jgi:transcriptional regulator with PAS, ATPase and Fis domain